MKRILISSIVMVVCLSLLAPPVLAGSKQRHRWQGVAIGVGAAMLGHAIISEHHRNLKAAAQERSPGYPPQRYREYSSPRVYDCPPPPPSRRGHWEFRKIWVPAKHKKVWNPGHYNRRGKWVPGKWIRIKDEAGHWVEKRVWVGYR
ncbi:hypothetical protein QUF80_02600 [Desulfococcaceae bacterium HSG8]|nr:hypothetical protein [Desulfococcaceae bacterium HSG8]